MAIDPINQHKSPWTAPIENGRILLVDENARDLRFLRLLLEGQGYEVTACSSFEAGAQCLAEKSFDLVIVDQGTPAFEGRRILERVLQPSRHQVVLVVTRCYNTNCYLDAMQMGAVDYMEKPLVPRALLRFVHAHVSGARAKQQGAG